MFVPSLWANLLPTKTNTFLLRPRGSHMPCVQAFATGIKVFDWQKVCLIAWSFPSVFLIHWFEQFRGHLDQPPKKGFDHLIQFDPSRKCFYMGHIEWLPLVRVTQDSSCFCRLLWQSVASFPDSQCILTWFIASLLVKPGNELGHVVMYPLLVACCFQSRNCKQHIKVG